MSAPKERKERECVNLDCLKKYVPVQANQRFCDECVESRKQVRKKHNQDRYYNSGKEQFND